MHPLPPSRTPGPFTQRRSSRKAGADHRARWAGAWGGEGSELEVLEWREEDPGHGTAPAGVAAPWGSRGGWRGLGLEDAYGRRGEREARCWSRGEGDADMGRRWAAWPCPGERERRWRGLGVEDAYARRGEQEALWGSGGEGDVDMGRGWCAWRRPGEQSGGCGGWGWRTLTGGAGNGTLGVARGGKGIWTWRGSGVLDGTRGSRSAWIGAPRGSGGALGSGCGAKERLRRGGAVGSLSTRVECAVRGGSGSTPVWGTGPRRGARLASEEVSTGPGGPRLVQPGTGGGQKSPALH